LFRALLAEHAGSDRPVVQYPSDVIAVTLGELDVE